MTTINTLLTQLGIQGMFPNIDQNQVVTEFVLTKFNEAQNDLAKSAIISAYCVSVTEKALKATQDAQEVERKRKREEDNDKAKADERKAAKYRNWDLPKFEIPTTSAYLSGKLNNYLVAFARHVKMEDIDLSTAVKALSLKSGDYLALQMQTIQEQVALEHGVDALIKDTLTLEEVITRLKNMATEVDDTARALDVFMNSKRKQGETYSNFVNRLFEEARYVYWASEGRNGDMEVWRVFSKNCGNSLLKAKAEEARKRPNCGSAETRSFVLLTANSVDKEEAAAQEDRHLIAKLDSPTLETLNEKLNNIMAVRSQRDDGRGGRENDRSRSGRDNDRYRGGRDYDRYRGGQGSSGYKGESCVQDSDVVS